LTGGPSVSTIGSVDMLQWEETAAENCCGCCCCRWSASSLTCFLKNLWPQRRRMRAYLEGVWRGRHQAGEEVGLMQVEGNPGAGRRQIPGGDAQGVGVPGQPGGTELDNRGRSLPGTLPTAPASAAAAPLSAGPSSAPAAPAAGKSGRHKTGRRRAAEQLRAGSPSLP